MSKLEMIKWLGTFFIIVSPIFAFYGYMPLNLLIIAFGTVCWFIAGLVMKDAPLVFVNVVSTILNTLAYLNN